MVQGLNKKDRPSRVGGSNVRWSQALWLDSIHKSRYAPKEKNRGIINKALRNLQKNYNGEKP